MRLAAGNLAVTENAILGGRVTLRQPNVGYRAGLDAALLAAACGAPASARVLDVGCGAGGALLAAAARRPDLRFVGVERDPEALRLALENIDRNDLKGRVNAMAGDIANGFASLGLAPFDAAMANPPFFDDPTHLRGPLPARKGAYIADDGLAAWIAFLIKAVREGGTVTLIHRADRLADLIAGLSLKAGSLLIRPIQPFADEPAKRVLVRATKTDKAPLTLLPALVLHDRAGGKHTLEVEAVLRGRADLGWGAPPVVFKAEPG